MVGSVSYPVTFKKEDVENETFVKYIGDEFKNNENFKTHEIKISNLGRVMVDNNIVETKEKKGLLYIFEEIPVHRLVGEIFLLKPLGSSSQIHHIDNNGYNNNIKNLIRITSEQHASIHHHMWENNFKFEDNELKFYFYKK
jgi:hypothetical protein